MRDCTYEDGYVVAERELEEGVEVVRIPTPAVVTIVTNSNTPRIASLRRKIDAMRKGVTVWTMKDLGIPPDWVGLRNSPTVVKKMLPFPRKDRKAKRVKTEEIGQMLEELVKEGIIELGGE